MPYLPQKLDFSGKRVVITGATGAIGQALAQVFHAHKADLILVGRNVEKLDALACLYPGVKTFSCDLSNLEQVHHLIQELDTLDADSLINNAGVTKDKLAIRMSLEDWDEVLTVNLKVAFMLSQSFIKKLIKKRSGCIVNVASIVGLTGNPGQANYVASKAGLMGLTKSLALEYVGRGVRINAIAPGYIASEMTANLPKQEALLSQIPMGRFGDPKDVAHGALFLASPMASYMTGQTLHINGGLACF